MTRCFVIASGPSLEGFDFNRLDKDVTIGLNYIFRYYVPTILHWIDNNIYDEFKIFLDILDCIKVSKKENMVDLKDTYKIPTSDKFNGQEGLTKGLYQKFLCGLTGLSLAIALGYSPVYMLGYDCQFSKGRGHFYSKEFTHKGDKREHIFKQGIKHFNAFKDWPEIYNCSPISLLTVFPRADIDEILKTPSDMDIHKERDRIRENLNCATGTNPRTNQPG